MRLNSRASMRMASLAELPRTPCKQRWLACCSPSSQRAARSDNVGCIFMASARSLAVSLDIGQQRRGDSRGWRRGNIRDGGGWDESSCSSPECRAETDCASRDARRTRAHPPRRRRTAAAARFRKWRSSGICSCVDLTLAAPCDTPAPAETAAGLTAGAMSRS